MSTPQSDSFSVQDTFRKSDISGKLILVLCTWFGVGLLPVAPGTFGSLAAVPLILVLDDLGMLYSAIAMAIVTGVAIWTSGRCEELLGQKDPQVVVIDEVAGFLFTMILLPTSWRSLGLGFILFRSFDILKPYPIRKVERLKGGVGIVMDDLFAGLYAYAGARAILPFL